MKICKFYSLGEEIFSAIVHGVGAGLSAAGLVFLILRAVARADALAVVSVCIYGSALIVLYMMSTMYHSLAANRAKMVFRIFDHCTIFFLIAGTYTPYALITLRGPLGWSIFGILWGLTALGIVLNAVNMEKFKKFSMICYIAMGWCIVLAFRRVWEGIGWNGVFLLVLGGVFYTAGIPFYLKKKVKYMHAIWHIFVLAGSVCQYFSVLFYVLK